MSLVLQNAILPFLRRVHPNPRPVSHLHLKPQFLARKFLAAFFGLSFRHPGCLASSDLTADKRKTFYSNSERSIKPARGNFKHKLGGKFDTVVWCTSQHDWAGNYSGCRWKSYTEGQKRRLDWIGWRVRPTGSKQRWWIFRMIFVVVSVWRATVGSQHGLRSYWKGPVRKIRGPRTVGWWKELFFDDFLLADTEVMN